MANKIRSKDEIIVITGKDKGKKGIVKKILSNGKAIVKGINMVKKHQKPAPSANRPGGIVEQESSIHISNIAIFNVKIGKSDRIGFKFDNGKKIRFFKSTKEIIK